MALQPETALRKRTDGRVEEVPAAELAFGDVVVLRPGARVLTDGVIMIGRGGRTSVHSQYAYHQFPICRCRWFGMAMEP